MNSAEHHTWHEANRGYLMASLNLVRSRLEPESLAEQEGLQQALRDAESSLPAPSALDNLCAVFNLSSFERELLLLAAGPELDASFADACRKAGALPPTLGFGLGVLSDPHWSGITPLASLRRWHLISVGDGDRLTSSPLRIDECILHYLAGAPCVDERLLSMTEELQPGVLLPPSQDQFVEQTITIWEMERAAGERLPVIRLRGSDQGALFGVASHSCARLGLTLRSIPVRFIPSAPADLNLFCRLFERDAALHSLALLLDCSDMPAEESGKAEVVHRLLDEVSVPLFVVGNLSLRPTHRKVISFDVAKPTPAEQQTLWVAGAAGLDLGPELHKLTSQFNTGAETIAAVTAEAQAIHAANEARKVQANSNGQAKHDAALELGNQTGHDSQTIGERFWNLCRAYQRPALDQLAQRIESSAGWDDLILHERQKTVLREMVLHARNQSKVYQDWGFARKGDRGLGITALFAGPSGTGKTMAAEILANELQLDLYRVDLSAIISKYIGETEKNLRKIFDAADDGGVLLLFDEADSTFGARSEVKDSHDRYANIEVSYLLQRIESYRGVAILTTNMKSAIDSAFLRRIRFLVNFPFPDIESRAEIWRRVFPATAPAEGLDPNRLAQLNVTGGHIRNIALSAAFLAAEAEEPIRMQHLLAAAKSEMVKLEKSITANEVKGWL